VRETLKAKIGVDYPSYLILGACNPDLAHASMLAIDNPALKQAAQVVRSKLARVAPQV
jgi:uncharacterized protein (DUF302 family)